MTQTVLRNSTRFTPATKNKIPKNQSQKKVNLQIPALFLSDGKNAKNVANIMGIP